MSRVLVIAGLWWSVCAFGQVRRSVSDGGVSTTASVEARDGGARLVVERCVRQRCSSGSTDLGPGGHARVRELDFGPGLVGLERSLSDGVHLTLFVLDRGRLTSVADLVLEGSGVRQSSYEWVADGGQVVVTRQLDNSPDFVGCLQPRRHALVFDWDARRAQLRQRPVERAETGCEPTPRPQRPASPPSGP